ncbi:MAG: major facilitator superfamily 1 [Frankiales bacterium]|jgi:CP family cyanate transporter-like MFS transporter|nr:major facilitator superfamily 1 [Frankiales bacterium]
MSSSTSATPVTTGAPRGRLAPPWLLVAAVVLAALNLRTAVTSVGPLLDELQRGIGLSSEVAGLLTALPLLSFVVFGSLTPSLMRRMGEQTTMLLGLGTMAVGLVLRATTNSVWLFLLFSVLALAGGAIGNVLLPALVKRHFSDRVGTMTATYTTAMAVGTAVPAAVAVPLSSVYGPDNWRLGLGAWAVPVAAAIVVWLCLPRRSGAANVVTGGGRRMFRSRTAWALATMFGSQSLLAFVAFGWFAQFYREQAGASATEAGLLVAFLTTLSIPVSMLVPWLAARMSSQRPMVAAFVACYVVAYTGMLIAPRAGVWLWAFLAGVGAGAFPLALTMIGLRSRTADTTADLSAFTQSGGYLLAGVGPLLVGVLHGMTGGWTWPFVLLFADLTLLAVTGWYAAQPRFVEDDLA